MTNEEHQRRTQEAARMSGQVRNLYQQGRHYDAITLGEQMATFCRTMLGPQDPGHATALNELAFLYQQMGAYSRAESLCTQALEIRHRVLGERHPYYTRSLNALAEILLDVGDYERAAAAAVKAVDVARRTLGAQHPYYANGLHNLARTLSERGDYKKAEQMFVEALSVTGRAVGESHPRYVECLRSLADLYLRIDDLQRAEQTFLRVQQLTREALGELHPKYAESLHDLALVHRQRGEYSTAKPLLLQALTILDQTVGKSHPSYATTLTTLTSVTYLSLDVKASLQHSLEALTLTRAALGEEHPAYVHSLINCGWLFMALTDLENAEKAFAQALELVRRLYGKRTPNYSELLMAIAAIHGMTGRSQSGYDLMHAAVTLETMLVYEVFSFASERQCLTFSAKCRNSTDLFFSFIRNCSLNTSDHVGSTYNAMLQRKGMTIEALGARDRLARSGQIDRLTSLITELSGLRSEITRRTLAEPDPYEFANNHAVLEEMTARREDLEAQLARDLPGMELRNRLRTVNVDAVAGALPPGSILVDYFRIDNTIEFGTNRELGKGTATPHYFVFVLPSAAPSGLRMLDLGEAAPIDRLIAEFRVGLSEVGSVFDYRIVGRQLRASVFGTVEEELSAAERIYVSPDGALNLLPFEALTDKTMNVCYISSARELLRHREAGPEDSDAAIVIANPKFDLRAGTLDEPACDVRTDEYSDAEIRVSRGGPDLKASGLEFSELSGAEEEGLRVASTIGDAEIWSGAKALEGRLKRIRSPRILHLATHGFFLTDEEADIDQARSLGSIWSQNRAKRTASIANPMLRSGLALAGAQTWLRGESLPPEAEDGILTAEDVCCLNLWGTELVLLSACDTGMGETRTGEGVFGLRRAFELAGARTVVMSLWKVDDDATRDFMTEFYIALKGGKTRLDALRHARESVRSKHLHPYYWCGFILQGDPNKMRW